VKLHKEVVIEAPVHDVFTFLDEPQNLPKIWPGLYEVMDVTTLTSGGHRFQFLYKMAGKHLKGTSETFERIPYERIVDKTMGDVQSTFTWKFMGENGTTKIFFDAEYEPPKEFFPKDELPYVFRQNEFEADTLLANLKARFES
jgi:uncharacterized protein YndB with AHSA1/START domain